jgi:CBS domain-containing protein
MEREMFTVEEFMITDLYTLSPDDSLFIAQSLMMEKNVRHLPVVNEEKHLIGLLTHRDLLAAAESTLDEGEPEYTPHGRKKPITKLCNLSRNVSEVMTTKLKVVEPKVSLRDAAIHLQKFRHGCLPVVENEKLIGIITDSDFVTIAINLIEQFEDTEPYNDDDF